MLLRHERARIQWRRSIKTNKKQNKQTCGPRIPDRIGIWKCWFLSAIPAPLNETITANRANPLKNVSLMHTSR